MLSINTNLSSIIAKNSIKTSTNKLNETIERMSTGYKINHARDNAANYSINTDMSTKIGAYEVAQDNTAMGLDMVTTASENLSQMQSRTERLRSLAVQARNGTYGAQSLQAMQTEANAITKEIERLYKSAEYNGVKLFDVVEKKTTDFESPTVNSQGFIKDIDRIDTSGMTRLSSITNRNVALADDSYAICSEEDLLALVELANNGKISAGDTFVMGADIDVGKYCDEQLANNNGGWTPIGDYATTSKSFTGTFNGNGHTISNVKIDRATSDYQGLFGHAGGTIKNLKVENVDIVGQNRVGGLVGHEYGGIIENTNITGKIEGSQYIGGLLGYIHGATLSDSYSNITVKGSQATGGLLGYIYGTQSPITNCFSTGEINGELLMIGGLFGKAYMATISECYSSVNVYAENANNVGAISGEFQHSQMIDCYSTGNVTGRSIVGGLVGNLYTGSSTTSVLSNCYSTSNVTGNGDTVGGLVGALNGEIKNCTMKGFVKNISSSNGVGGIIGVGNTEFLIKDCSFEGDGIFNSSKSGLLMASLRATISEINISGCQIVSNVENPNATLIGNANSSVACNINIADCTYNSYYDEIGIPLIKSQNANATVNMENVSANLFENNLNMQIGVDGYENSSLNLSTSFFINDFNKFKNITSDDYFTTIDNFLNLVSQKQVQFGAMQNRLESALDEIEIQSSNLISSRSTIRDADMAEISSTYIQQQILQQAAATLMSTANQSPAIALQLI